jgi:hypothetical protein
MHFPNHVRTFDSWAERPDRTGVADAGGQLEQLEPFDHPHRGVEATLSSKAHDAAEPAHLARGDGVRRVRIEAGVVDEGVTDFTDA